MATPAFATISAELLGHRLTFRAAAGLFSSNVVDDGTKLLLEHLPSREPKTVLDLGCGYGALGLPIAKRYPAAGLLLVDRDTLAVEWSRRNAESNALLNVDARPSLGYRDVEPERRFDWVLCNVPARIGEEAIGYLMGEGARRLEPDGELRVVVIRDLGVIVEELAARNGWKLARVVDGPRHTVFALGRQERRSTEPVDHEGIYARDEVEVGGLKLERPHDISEDPGHLAEGMPLLLEVLPRSPKGRALVYRGSYGASAVTMALRGIEVLAADRDLIATTFARRNAERLGTRLQTREGFELAAVVQPKERFAWVVGELHAAAGRESVERDLVTSVELGAESSTVLWLGLTKQAKGWIDGLVKKRKLAATAFATRGAYTVWRVLPVPKKR